jgi:hypothetical protein
MQEQGVRPDDPEFIKAHNLLAAIQRQQAFQKQQRMAQQQAQQAQQQRQQQQINGATPEAANGSHGKLCVIYYSHPPNTMYFTGLTKFSQVAHPRLPRLLPHLVPPMPRQLL